MHRTVGGWGWVRWACALWLAGLLMTAPAEAQRRLAFVVGIDTYDNLATWAQLKKAKNDAAAIAKAFGSLGFEVTIKVDLKRSEFNDAWTTFIGQVQQGDIVAIFFAGHGVELGGRNYLIAKDVPGIKPGRDEQLRREALSVVEFMTDLRERKPRFSLLILDACRDNPFERLSTRSLGGERGLAPVEPPRGMFTIYSAGQGEAALDGLARDDPHPNSVFTRQLLPLLTTPGLPLSDMGDRVRASVHNLAASVKHLQTPAVYNQLIGPACLSGTTCGGGGGPSDPEGTALALWNEVKFSKEPAVIRDFYKKFAHTVAGGLALEKLSNLERKTMETLQAELASKIAPAPAGAPTGRRTWSEWFRESFARRPGAGPPVGTPGGGATASAPQLPDIKDDERVDWRVANLVNTVASYEEFLRKWPVSYYAEEAKHELGLQKRRTYTLAEAEAAAGKLNDSLRKGVLSMRAFAVAPTDAACKPTPATVSVLRGLATSWLYYHGLLSYLRDGNLEQFPTMANIDSADRITSNPRALGVQIEPAALLGAVARVRQRGFPLAGEEVHIRALARMVLSYKAEFDARATPDLLREFELGNKDMTDLGITMRAEPCFSTAVELQGVGSFVTDERGEPTAQFKSAYYAVVLNDWILDFWYRRKREGTDAAAAAILAYIVRN